MTYKVMLIDDEPWTMVYMKKMFKWKEMGFEVIAETQNSMEALELIEQFRPDVVFTDIRMPQMSGIELMQELRKQGIGSEFVIASGFAEFDYAQEAVKLGVFEYCLKPISSEKAEELLGRLGQHLRSKQSALTPEGPNEVRLVEEDVNLTMEGQIKFTDMLEYIRCNISEKLQLKDLAKRFYLNPNYCCTLFGKFTGMTFSEYVTDLRMKEAASLLIHKNYTIDEVAKKIGYQDYFYFNKVFKKYYGLTPSEYRKIGRSSGDGRILPTGI